MRPETRTLAVLSAVVFLVMTGISIVVPVVPLMGKSFGVSEFLIGVLVGSLAGARVFLDLPSGVLGDRFGNRRMMMTGLGIVAVTSLLAVIPGRMEPGIVPYVLLVLIRISEGVGSAFYVTSSLAALARSAPQGRRGSHMSVYVSALLTGQIVGPVIGGGAAAVGGLTAPFVVYGLLALGGLAMIATYLPRATASATAVVRGIDWKGARAILANRSFLLVNLGTMAAFFIRAGIISTVLPFHTAHILGIPLDSPENHAKVAGFTGLLITTIALASLVTMWPAGRWSDRRGRKAPFVVSLVLAGLTAPFIYAAQDWWTLVAVMVVYGFVLGLHGPLASWSSDLVPAQQMGVGMGLYRTISDLGFLLGPLVMGAVLQLVASDTDVTVWPFLIAGSYLVATGLLLLAADDPVGRRLRAERASVNP